MRSLTRSLLPLTLLICIFSSGALASDRFDFDISINAFTYNGVTYPAANFTLELPNLLFNATTLPELPTTYDGLQIAGVQSGISGGDYLRDIFAFNNDIDPLNGEPQGAAGTIVGFFSPDFTNFNDRNQPIFPSGTFTVLIGTGCVGSPAVCGTGNVPVHVDGTISLTLVHVPEPPAWTLSVFACAGLLWCWFTARVASASARSARASGWRTRTD